MRRLSGKIILRGIGLHSGKECGVTLEAYDTSEVMMRVSDEECVLSKLSSDGTMRGSDYIFPSGERVRTCEHVLSALSGLEIYSGVRITVEGGEMPALDGCSRVVCEEIMRNSIEDGEKLPYVTIREPLIVSSEGGKRFVAVFPADEFHVTYTVEYEKVGVQTLDYVSGKTDYAEEIAPARTFAMKRDIEYLRAHGMALGGSLKNAVLIGEVIEADGGLRWPDEFVRHKVLDIMGDIYSVGYPLKAHVIAMRAGHELHLRLAEKMKGAIMNARD